MLSFYDFLPAMSPRGWSRVNHRMKMETPVFCTPVSMGLLQILAKVHPKAKPSHGRPIPVSSTVQDMSSKIYRLAQTPKTMMKRMRKSANGFKILTMNAETLGRYLEMSSPMLSERRSSETRSSA